MRTEKHLNFRLFPSLFFLSMVATASGKIIFVDAGATGKNDGSSWTSAYKYLQDGLSAGLSGDQIWVAEGVYRPDRGIGITPGDRTATFQLKNGVALYGGFVSGQTRLDERDPEVCVTILSGDLNGNDGPNFTNNGENSYHVVTGSGTNETAVLDGFTITGGNADGIIQQPRNEMGGGMYNESSRAKLINCAFTVNTAKYAGGGVSNMSSSSPTLANCTFRGNSAQDGGAMWNFVECSPTITNCTFSGNHASSSGGGIYNQGLCSPILTNCKIIGNAAGIQEVSYGRGGGMFNRDGCNPVLINCIIVGNIARGDSGGGGGGGIYNWNVKITSSPILVNCTFTGNSAPRGRSLACDYYFGGVGSTVGLTNCILWDNENKIWNSDGSVITITYSDVKGGWPGEGNINTDPLFVEAGGADYYFGTDDDNLQLLPDSPCIDTGDNSAVPEFVCADLDGNLRVMNRIVDMGAYEFRWPLNLYVDAISGNNNNDGLTRETAFAAIRKGIDTAEDGDTVWVYPGVYSEEINFLGKAITVQGTVGATGIPVLQNPGDFAASFYHGESPDSVLKNFVIRNSFMAVFIAGSSPTITNVTIVNNKYGIEAYAGAEPDISSSILWGNTHSNLFQCQARYSCIEGIGRDEGEGNINVDPCFVDPARGDYHLISERGRNSSAYNVWVLDKVTSPCVDGGDPTTDPSGEPVPNGGRVDMGAYGGTAYASMSEKRWLDGDINHDGIVDMIDFSILAENWLQSEQGMANQRPEVRITVPPDGAKFPLGIKEIRIEADASDIDGLVVKVEFFADEVKIAEDNDGSDGWKATYRLPALGTYVLTARATDDRGAMTISPSVEVFVWP